VVETISLTNSPATPANVRPVDSESYRIYGDTTLNTGDAVNHVVTRRKLLALSSPATAAEFRNRLYVQETIVSVPYTEPSVPNIPTPVVERRTVFTPVTTLPTQ